MFFFPIFTTVDRMDFTDKRKDGVTPPPAGLETIRKIEPFRWRAPQIALNVRNQYDTEPNEFTGFLRVEGQQRDTAENKMSTWAIIRVIRTLRLLD